MKGVRSALNDYVDAPTAKTANGIRNAWPIYQTNAMVVN